MPDIAYPERVVNVNVKITDRTAWGAVAVHQNTSGRPLIMIITARCKLAWNAGYANVGLGVSDVDASGGGFPGGWMFAPWSGYAADGGNTARVSSDFTLVAVVPPAYWFRLYLTADGTSTASLELWMEVQL